ncbi:MAG: hypothetical protein PVJ04_11980 [Gemmatimonadota bacterium]|jgi:hypothetical protein
MNRILWIALALILPASPSLLWGQGLAIGGRAGTLGFGGELALGLSDVFVLRGGFGVFPYEYEDTFEDTEYTVTLPSAIWSAGIDIYLGGGPIRVMGGVMGRTSDVELYSEFTESAEIGGTQYDVPGTLSGVLKQDAIAPFAGIGFGKHTSGRFGFFLDIGAALSSKGDVALTAGGPVALEPGIQESLQKEADKVKEDAGGLLKVWPIVSAGIKIPLNFGY